MWGKPTKTICQVLCGFTASMAPNQQQVFEERLVDSVVKSGSPVSGLELPGNGISCYIGAPPG